MCDLQTTGITRYVSNIESYRNIAFPGTFKNFGSISSLYFSNFIFYSVKYEVKLSSIGEHSIIQPQDQVESTMVSA